MSYLSRSFHVHRRRFLRALLALPAFMLVRRMPAEAEPSKAEPAEGFVQIGGWILKRSDLK